MIKKIAVKLIDFYRNCVSSLKLPSCRFHPSCSQYTKEAVTKYGVFRGGLKGIFRILRCQPFSKGGYDPVR